MENPQRQCYFSTLRQDNVAAECTLDVSKKFRAVHRGL